MSEEEKEAIGIAKTFDYRSKTINYNKLSAEDVEAINIILNLIDKQQKENEELKEENFDQVYMKAIADYKDKIRNKIKELEEEIRIINEKENGGTHYIQVNVLIDFLKELIGDVE